MRSLQNFLTAGCLCAAVGVFTAAPVHAQQLNTVKKKNAKTNAAPAGTTQTEPASRDRVIIDRQALKLIDPKTYQVPLQLSPIRSVELSSAVAGVVRTVHLKSGDKVNAQTEAVRLDSTEQQLLLEQAKADYDAVQVEQRRAQKQNDADLIELTEAKLHAAKAGLDLATYRLDQTRIRAPFGGEVFRVHVTEGQYVRAGEPLMQIGDTSRLQVEIPVDRKDVSAGKTLSLRVEETPVEGKVAHVLPLSEVFEPLRNVLPSAASAVVVLDNPQGQFHVGQTVYAPLIPRQPIAEVPISSIANGPEGSRKVQVVREHIVRDIRVDLLGQIGNDRIYVSGPFAAADEVVVRASRELPDGTQIRPVSTASAQGAASPRSAESRSAAPRSETKSSKPDF